MKDYSLASLVGFARQRSMDTNQPSQGKMGITAKARTHFSFCKPWFWSDGKAEVKSFIAVMLALNAV